MGNTSNFIASNRSVIQHTSGTLASIGLAGMGKTVAGNLITPAVWVSNYAMNGATPDSLDIGLYLIAFSSAVAAPATIATGLLKSVIDDDTARKLKEVRMGIIDSRHRPFIIPCSTYSRAPQVINAQLIAAKGGTAWLHTNGLWVYIIDAKTHLVLDYKPTNAMKIFQADYPLKLTKNGGFRWSIVR